MDRLLAESRAGRNLNAVQEAGLRRLGKRAFARDFHVEEALCPDGAESRHAETGSRNYRRAKMPVNLHGLHQPRRITGLLLKMRLRQSPMPGAAKIPPRPIEKSTSGESEYATSCVPCIMDFSMVAGGSP